MARTPFLLDRITLRFEARGESLFEEFDLLLICSFRLPSRLLLLSRLLACAG
jgi:hypothetical protein